MTNRRDEIDAEAAGWVIRLRTADADAWAAFTDWLEADPAHAAAYDDAALADEDWGALAPAEPLVAPAPAPQPLPHGAPERRLSRRFFLGTGIAAAFAAVVGLGIIAPAPDNSYAIETAAGERRTVQLADGSRIDLNGNSRVRLDPDDVRSASLEQGEALFTVVHDDNDPFEVRAAGALLRDLGTVFNVALDGRDIEVGVAEGIVLFNPDSDAVSLDAGMTLRREGPLAPRVERRAPEAITGWREGRLTYGGTHIGRVAADLSRNLGVTVSAAPQVANRPFTGVIRIDGADQTIERAARLMGVGARRQDGGWMLTAGASDTP